MSPLTIFFVLNPFCSGALVLPWPLGQAIPCCLGSHTYLQPSNMSLEVGQLAAVTTQVKLFPNDEEELAI
jgi:hypothetical protein